MKFYDCPTAPSPRRVRMFIVEKQLHITTVAVDLKAGEHLEPPFLSLNPFATVPVLALDDGTTFTTTSGCRQYLEAAYPTPPLLGRDPVERGLIADRLWRIEMDAFMAVAECLRNSAKGMKGRALTGTQSYEQIPDLAERGRRRAQRFFPVLDEWLASGLYLAGDTVSAADIDAFIFVEFAKWIKLENPEPCANIASWYQRMSARPSATA